MNSIKLQEVYVQVFVFKSYKEIQNIDKCQEDFCYVLQARYRILKKKVLDTELIYSGFISNNFHTADKDNSANKGSSLFTCTILTENKRYNQRLRTPGRSDVLQYLL